MKNETTGIDSGDNVMGAVQMGCDDKLGADAFDQIGMLPMRCGPTD